MDEPAQARFNVDSLENGLAFDSAWKDGAGDEIGCLLRIGYGIEVAENLHAGKESQNMHADRTFAKPDPVGIAAK